MNPISFTPESIYALSKDYVTAVFPGDHDERTSAVGFLTEEGDALATAVSDPVTILAIAHRLVQLADEIAQNQAADLDRLAAEVRALGPDATMNDLVAHRSRLAESGVVSLDQKRAQHAPQTDL